MAAVRSAVRLLAVRPLARIATRGYADEMNFTFAAGNSVIIFKFILFLPRFEFFDFIGFL